MALLDQLHSLSPGQVAVVIFLALAAWGFVWGVVRQLFGMLALAAGCVVGWLVFTKVRGFSWMQEFDDRYLFWISLIAGLMVFFFLRVCVHWLLGFGDLFALVSRMFGKSRGKGPLGAVLSILPSAFLVVVVFLALRLVGVFEGLDRTREAVFAAEGSAPPDPTTLSRISSWVSQVPWREWMDQRDFLEINATEKLGKILLVSRDKGALQRLQKNPRCRELMQDARMQALIADFADGGGSIDQGKLLPISLESLRGIAGDPALRALLEQLDVDQLIHEVLYEEPENEREASRRSFRPFYR